MRPTWKWFHRPVDLGFLPDMLSEADPTPAREQLDRGYRHGGGWQPFNGFRLLANGCLKYAGDDPPIKPLAMTRLRHELIVLYEHDWVLIQQPDKSFEVCRMD
jgi:hypothetical protein